MLITPAEWATAQANAVKYAKFVPGFKLTLNAVVERKLEYAEAEKRGVTCTTREAAAQFRANSEAVVATNPDVILHNGELAGDVPDGYTLEPEAQRSPATADALNAIEINPASIERFRVLCSIGKLYDSLNPSSDSNERTKAIDALNAKLRADAQLEYGSDAAVSTATP